MNDSFIPFIWLILFFIIVVLLILWNKKQEEAKKQAEENRVNFIMSKEDDWGHEMCQWLIKERVDPGEKRVKNIMSRLGEFGPAICQDLIKRIIATDMTAEMVRLSLGEPTTIDNREATPKSEKYRWVYGVPRQGAAYIWFKDDKVVRIKQ